MIPIATVLVSDPPWRFGDSLPGKTRGASKQYACMTTEDICALRIPPVAQDALLFLWRVASMPDDGLRVCRAWGFEPKTEIVWEKLHKGSGSRRLDKDFVIPAGTVEADVPELVFREVVARHMGMGRYVRGAHEVCVVATRGRATSLVRDRGIRSSFFAPVGEHSEKPEAFYDIVERLAPGPYVELFGRRQRKGWTVIGDALGTTIETGTVRPRRAR